MQPVDETGCADSYIVKTQPQTQCCSYIIPLSNGP